MRFTPTHLNRNRRRLVALAATVAVSAAFAGGHAGAANAGIDDATTTSAAQTERASSCFDAARLGVPCDLGLAASESVTHPNIECVSAKLLNLYFMVQAWEGRL